MKFHSFSNKILKPGCDSDPGNGRLPSSLSLRGNRCSQDSRLCSGISEKMSSRTKEDAREKGKENAGTLDKSLPSLGLSLFIGQLRSWKISKIPHRVMVHGCRVQTVPTISDHHFWHSFGTSMSSFKIPTWLENNSVFKIHLKEPWNITEYGF